MEQGWPGLAQYIPSTPADWNPRPRTVQDALDQLAAGGSAVAAANMFVWQPGGTTAKNIYATLAALEAALQDIQGPKIVGVDTTHGAATVDTTGMPAGGWRFNDTTWMPCLSTTIGLVTFAVGAKLDPSVQNLTLRNMEWVSNATATVWTPTGGLANLRLDLGILVCSAAGAFLDCAAAGTVIILGENGSAIGDGTHTVIKIENTGDLDLALMTGSELQNNSIAQGTAGGGTAAISSDGSCIVGHAQGAGPVYGYVIEDPTTSFVFAPGAVQPQNRNVFTTWDDLMNAVQPVRGMKSILVDDSLGQAHATAGTWNTDNCIFVAQTSGTTVLHLDDGCVWDFTNIFIDNGLTVSQDGSAPVITLSGTGFASVTMRDDSSVLQSTTASPFASLTGTSFFSLDLNGQFCIAGDGTHPVIQMAAGTEFALSLSGSEATFSAHALKGAAGTFVVVGEASSVLDVQADFAGVTNQTFAALAKQTAYTPSTAGNWHPVPTLASAALDQLAAPNIQQAAQNTGTGTTTTSAVTPNIAKLRSGKVQVRGVATGIISANGTVTVSLLRDATPILALPALTVLSTTAFSIPINFFDTLPDAANHTYTVQAVADGAHTITVGAGGNLISAQEL